MTVDNPVGILTNPRHCGKMRGQNKSGPSGAGNTVIPGLTPLGGAMASLPTHDRRPHTIGDDIRDNHAGDPAAWLAALTGLPVEHVRAKLAAVRP